MIKIRRKIQIPLVLKHNRPYYSIFIHFMFLIIFRAEILHFCSFSIFSLISKFRQENFLKKPKVKKIVLCKKSNKTLDFENCLLNEPLQKNCTTKKYFFINILNSSFSLFCSFWHKKRYINKNMVAGNNNHKA